MADDLEVSWNVLELFRDVLADQAQAAAASGAAAGLTVCIVMSVIGWWLMHL